MPKQKKSAAKPNKSAFVRSLAFDTPSADVIARAKAKGMTLTRNDVHAIRAIARRKSDPGKTSTKSKKSKRGGAINKSAFVRSLGSDLSAADVIAEAKAKGITLSAAQVYTIRANARRKGEVGGARAKPAAVSGRAASSGGTTEAAFVRIALELGLIRAESILGSLRNRAAAGLS
jgi:lambda repressor-like predicted transcriptional regulator